LFGALAAAAWMAAAAAAEIGPAGPRLLRPGDFHGAEVAAVSGEGWLCLVTSEAGAELKPCRIDVSPRHDEVLDDHSGKRVSTPGTDQVFVLFRDLPGLKPGPVPTAFRGELELADRDVELVMGSAVSILRAPATLDGGYEIVCRSGNASAVLFQSPNLSPDSPPLLLWAGDLNHDAELDLLLDTTHHYNIESWALYLSTPGDDECSQKEVARLTTSGC
jgi:hypothetical protein